MEGQNLHVTCTCTHTCTKHAHTHTCCLVTKLIISPPLQQPPSDSYNVTGYIITIRTSSGINPPPIMVQPATRQNYTITEVPKSDTYTITVAAYNVFGTGRSSASVLSTPTPGTYMYVHVSTACNWSSPQVVTTLLRAVVSAVLSSGVLHDRILLCVVIHSSTVFWVTVT